jgi:hypothetical protein
MQRVHNPTSPVSAEDLEHTPYNVYYFVQVLDIYSNLNETDRTLINHWMPNPEIANEHDKARLLSARAAEKAVRNSYTYLDHQVYDIAVTQLETPQGGDWKTHDLHLCTIRGKNGSKVTRTNVETEGQGQWKGVVADEQGVTCVETVLSER